jgi:microcystin-dependent protein
MAQPYVGEIKMFAGNFAPAGWMFCEGQLLPISEYETLFNLIGTTYGGDGQSTFALPDLRGRIPIHAGSGFTLAETGGVEQVTLTTQQIPAHQHAPGAVAEQATSRDPAALMPAKAEEDVYAVPSGPASIISLPNATGFTGGNQPHTNLQPYLCVDFIISLFGIYPSPT